MPDTPHALVTGGAGFIGSHLTEYLLSQGRRVTVVDDLSTGRRENLPTTDASCCRLIVAKAADALADPQTLAGVDEVYHLAASVGVRLIVDDPAGMIQNNVQETVTVLQACVCARASVLLASSSEVYGKCPVLPLREDMDLVFGPTTASRWSYGMTKALDEHLAFDMARQSGLRVVAARLFNTIGPRQIGRYGMVVPRFIAAAVSGQPLEVYGDGEQTRTFCDVRDVVRAMPALLACEDAAGLAVNLGSDQVVTINALAHRVITAARGRGHADPGIRRVSYEAVYGEGFEDTPHRLPDLSRATDLIGFAPTRSLDDTLHDLMTRAESGVTSQASHLRPSGGGSA